jgi:hypothetical protein
MDCRPTGSNPFHPSRGPLAAILPLFSRRLQFPILAGPNRVLIPGEHVLRRDVPMAVFIRTLEWLYAKRHGLNLDFTKHPS